MTGVPEPLATDAAVAVDLAAHTVSVMPAAPGHAALLWRAGYRTLVEHGHSARAVWAGGFGKRQAAVGVPENGALTFTFRAGDPTWARLVTAADLRAIVVVDRRARTIMSVKFLGREPG